MRRQRERGAPGADAEMRCDARHDTRAVAARYASRLILRAALRRAAPVARRAARSYYVCREAHANRAKSIDTAMAPLMRSRQTLQGRAYAAAALFAIMPFSPMPLTPARHARDAAPVCFAAAATPLPAFRPPPRQHVVRVRAASFRTPTVIEAAASCLLRRFHHAVAATSI
jgi:hypothetical protein